jgi:glycosyltransferase involved in cell wall biosynthesis
VPEQVAPRTAVYGEFSYRRDAEGLSTDQSFALFVERLGDFVEGLVIVGRLAPEPGRSHHSLGNSFEFAELPDYPSLARIGQALRAALASVPVLWRVAGDVDAVWVLGPNPLAILFALIARARGRRVVLGVRQDIVALTRTRHRGRLLNLSARALEGIWRLLARRLPVVAVGPAVAEGYRHAREVVPIVVSLVEEENLVPVADALERDYSGELRVLSVGRLEPQKNPLILAEVLAILRERDPRWRLTVCGEGSLQADLARELDRRGVADAAELLGYVPAEGGLGALYRESHFFLHVSLTEGYPQVLLEAFAGGTPVVATDVGGVAEGAGAAAALVPPRDAHAAANALEHLAADPDRREALIRAGLVAAAANTAAGQCERVAAVLAGEAVSEPQSPSSKTRRALPSR